jgi:hypothetical protein
MPSPDSSRITGKVVPSTLSDFYRADLDDWLAIGVVRDVADNFLRLRPPRLNKCVDGLEVKVIKVAPRSVWIEHAHLHHRTFLSKIGRCETPSSSKKCGAAEGLTPAY